MSRSAGGTGALKEHPAISEIPGACNGCPLVTVMVCRKCEGHEEVIDFLRSRTPASVRTVRCQKVCKSPVAGLSIGGRMEWFGKLGSPKSLKALAWVAGSGTPGKLPKPLRNRRSKKRSGCRPR